MKTKRLIILFSLLVFIIGCSTPEKTTKRDMKKYKVVKKYVNDVNLELGKNISWVNMMPGTQPKFHVSGKVSLLADPDYNLDETVLKYIKIFQGDKEIYYIMPKVHEEVSVNKKDITYSTIKGLNISEELNREKPVRFELIFKEGKKELKYYIRELIVEEVQ